MERLEPRFQQAAAGDKREEGFTLSLELSEEIRAISLRDGGMHPCVIRQAKDGKISIMELEHKGILAELRKDEMGHIPSGRSKRVNAHAAQLILTYLTANHHSPPLY
jgi:hypothetical protein